MPASERLYLGSHEAHIAAYYERIRLELRMEACRKASQWGRL